MKKVLIPNLSMLETVEKVPFAEKLNKELEKEERELDVLVQVQTSDEDSKQIIDSAKHGCKPKNVMEVVRYVHEECRWLK